MRASKEELKLNVSVLIPYRSDGGSRERVWDYILPEWEQTGLDICVGSDSGVGPFNCAMAQNNAFRQSKYDVLAMFGADQLPHMKAIHDGVNILKEGWDWLPIMSETAYYSRQATEMILKGRDPYRTPLDNKLPYCTGIVMLTREAYVEVGGMDERFVGWGFEDTAFRQTLTGRFGHSPCPSNVLRCLWHETPNRTEGSPNSKLMEDYIPLTSPGVTKTYLQKRGSYV